MNVFIHSAVEGHMCFFLFWKMMKKTAVNIPIQGLCVLMFLNLLGKYLAVKCCVEGVFSFTRTARAFSKVFLICLAQVTG